MASTKNKVLFRFGSRAEYDALTSKDSNSLYFLLDTNELYRGEVPVGTAHLYQGVRQNDETVNDAIVRILDSHTPVLNDLLILAGLDSIEDLYIYTIEGIWKQLHATIRSSSVLFSDGQTLEEKLEHLQSTISVNEAVLEMDEGVLSVKNYGKQYYAYIPEVPASGLEGQPDYVPAVPGHYELVTVDEDHPWKDGLTPRTTSNGSIAWYEPNLSRLDGINDTVASLQELLQNVSQVNNEQTQALESLQENLSSLNDLQAVVGTIGNPVEETESTGLIKRIETLENNTGSALRIKTNGTLLIPVDGEVNIPLFDASQDGLVPRVNSSVSSLEPVNMNHMYLSAVGWNDPFGSMTHNDTVYETVTEYVDARVEDVTLRWQSINE